MHFLWIRGIASSSLLVKQYMFAVGQFRGSFTVRLHLNFNTSMEGSTMLATTSHTVQASRTLSLRKWICTSREGSTMLASTTYIVTRFMTRNLSSQKTYYIPGKRVEQWTSTTENRPTNVNTTYTRIPLWSVLHIWENTTIVNSVIKYFRVNIRQ